MTSSQPPLGAPADPAPSALRAVVTGASSGIGAATVRALRSSGWEVIAAARRADRLQALADETGAVPMTLDVTSQESVDAFAAEVSAAGPVHALVNNAGGAFGADPVADAVTKDWEWMYNVNVLGSMRMTRALLPALRDGGQGSILFLTSTAALAAYEGGAGYCGVKAAQQSMARSLRLEEAEHNIRVVEVSPGMVHTEEFSLNRLGGDQDAADSVYNGVPFPLTAEDVADAVAFTLNAPHHVNIDQLVLRPLAQAANHKVLRR
ncbi:SDR family oxidoreductase [Arthrobacter agilis]|uniref:SDR family oxidoreductase n=1 Tax=Arthrobacter agilis TaxID=37921 RepID=UPI000B352EE9|nr:SDR family oxidoreductase [Arthrobacter agilis]OUM44761.1 oxidoreductase [Arthrobacter agilis]PPB47086.1 SDR family NAD(P)-dependent oxidoreductase [Arthrobacter agilis]TPV22500.1 SDR family oxidoreductase [Arthrobacter agilis]VDR32316.1 Serine 3-dehydrogenase [Arthrobacter agilis]